MLRRRPMPAEVADALLRFVPANENFGDTKSSNQNVPLKQRDKPFSSIRISGFWRLQFVHKQWRDVVQHHLGDFEVKLSAKYDSGREAEDIETAVIWNEFVAFNLNKDAAGLKGLGRLNSDYLNCFISSAKLFYLIPPQSRTDEPPEAQLSRILRVIFAIFPDQRLPLHLRLWDGRNPEERSLHPNPVNHLQVLFPANVSLDALEVSGKGMPVDLLGCLLLAGQPSLKSLRANARLFATVLGLLGGGVVFESLTDIQLSYLVQGTAPGEVPFQASALPGAFPNLERLVLPHEWPPVSDLGPLLRLQRLSSLDYRMAPAGGGQTGSNINHDFIKSLRINVDRANNPIVGLRVAKCLEVLEMNGVARTMLKTLADNIGVQSTLVDFSKVKSFHLSISKQRQTDLDKPALDELLRSGVQRVFEKFQHHCPGLDSLTLSLKASDVPENFGQFLLEKVPIHGRHVTFVNLFQKKAASSWKDWVFDIVDGVIKWLPDVGRVVIVSSPKCFASRYEGLAEFCRSLLEWSRMNAVDLFAFFDDATTFLHTAALKHVCVHNDRESSLQVEYELEFVIQSRDPVMVASKTRVKEQQITFHFKNVPALEKKNCLHPEYKF